jgi:nucleotide-binding universal stress UspA family protein
MTVLVAGTQTPEGMAAHRYALEEAVRRQEDVVYFVLGGDRPDPALAVNQGVRETCQDPDARSRDAAGDLLDWSERLQASTIVVGVKHRSPVGKLLLGSAAQQIILEANVPVICVKP